MIERLVVVNKNSVIDDFDLPKGFHTLPPSKQTMPATQTLSAALNQELSLEDAVNEVEKNLVLQAYHELGSSYEVAKTLKVSQSKASRLIRKYLQE